MASEKQIAANRANAKRSTGPRTLAGKIVSSRNAFRHGLSGPLRLNPGTSVKVDAIARAISAIVSILPEQSQSVRPNDGSLEF